jgi:hypothetical protein
MHFLGTTSLVGLLMEKCEFAAVHLLTSVLYNPALPHHQLKGNFGLKSTHRLCITQEWI